MKILLYTDVHFCKSSSIVTGRGKRFSTRLENIIESLNWAENLGKEKRVAKTICLGDFFDRPNLNDEELTALNSIEWNDGSEHIFLVGNHEAVNQSLAFSSTQALTSVRGGVIQDTIDLIDADEHSQIMFLPYVTEDSRKRISDYDAFANGRDPSKKLIVCSHNDIKGIRYGAFESKQGFDLADIEASCDMFINGHLHNGDWLNGKKTILNLGNLTGQNFSEDAFRYKHQAMILDTDGLSVEFHENPFAMNFYKIQVACEADIKKLDRIKGNAVLSVKCSEAVADKLESALDGMSGRIVERKVTVYSESGGCQAADSSELVRVDNHLDQFRQFIMTRGDDEFADRDLVMSELTEVCRQ